MTYLEQFIANKLVAIIRGLPEVHLLPVAKTLVEGGIRSLEITLNTPGALGMIRTLREELGDRLLVGAGTVLDVNGLQAAVKAGAQFIISPHLEPQVVHAAKVQGVISIPGAYTPTEIVHAYAAGADIVKLFPASIGPGYLKDVRAPLPHIPLMPTGGIHEGNLEAFFHAGATACGIGSALVDARQESSPDALARLLHKTRQLVAAIPHTSLS